MVLASKLKKGKGKFNNGNKKKDLSKVKCFTCDEFGHYASKCPQRKKGGNEKKKETAMVASSTAKQDDFTRKFEEFSPISHFSKGTIGEGAWFIESGASKHTTRSHLMLVFLASDKCSSLGLCLRD